MPFAIELHLDAASDARVREIWAALDEIGVPSLASSPGAAYRPHVSLAAFDDIVIERTAEQVLPAMAACVGMPLHMASFGFFMSEPAVAFLGVVPTKRFREAHRQVVAAAEPIVSWYWPYYLPDALVPHCTLAMGVTSPADVTNVASRCRLPFDATATSVHLVDVLTGERVLSTDGS